jgi:ferrous iron transport protein A
MTLAQVPLGQPVTIQHVGGTRAFRRRLMEFGLVPGTHVELVGIAPLGDPLELLVRGCSLSIRRGEALCVSVLVDGSVTVGTQAARLAPACAGGCGSLGCVPQGAR